MALMEVQFFIRKPNNIFFSIEELFEAICKELQNEIIFRNNIMPYKGTGIINRMKNILFSVKKCGKINHITGDIHYLGIFLPRKNTILTIHDCGELDKQKGFKRVILWLFWFYLPVKRLKYITVISETTKARLLRHVNTNPDKIQVIPNCLIGNYTTGDKTFNNIKPIILQVGVTPNKNLERVAAALESIPCVLRIIGVPSSEQLIVLAKYKIDFEWVTSLSREQVLEEYKNCDFVIFVSLLEGFGLPIIEAQATGKVIITSNINPMASTAGEGACLVDPFTVEEIRKGVLKVINDAEYRKRLTTIGEQNYKRFLPSAIASQYLRLYKNIYANNKVINS
ncbi:MAG: glycosyltransferase [Agriterribacter sp.]